MTDRAMKRIIEKLDPDFCDGVLELQQECKSMKVQFSIMKLFPFFECRGFGGNVRFSSNFS